MNRDEALAFLNPQKSPLEAPIQGESMSPDGSGQQLVEQPVARGMSREDALNFLTAKTEETTPKGSDASYLTSPVPSDPNNLTSNYIQSVPQATPQPTPQASQRMSKEDALAFLTSPSQSEQTAAPINLPAIPWYENLAKSTVAQTAAMGIQTAGGFERAGSAPITDISGVNAPFQRGATTQEATSAFDNAISDKQAALDSIKGIVNKQGFSTAEYGNQINDLQQQIGDLEAQKEQTLKLPQYSSDTEQQALLQQRQQLGQSANQLSKQASGMFPALGVNQRDTSISAQLGRGIGSVIGLAPALATGPLALPTMAVMGGSQAYGEGYDAKVQELKQQGITDAKELDNAGQKAGSEAAVSTIPSLAAYTVGGVLTAKATSALLKSATPVVKALVGGTAAAGVNLGVSAGLRASQGQSAFPTIEQAVPDILFGVPAGVGAFFENKPVPKLNPSADPAVNQKEAAITVGADAQQAPLPEAPVPINIPAKEAPTTDVRALRMQQMLYDEGSPEHTKIQADIDALNKPAETPAEAQPAPIKLTGFGKGDLEAGSRLVDSIEKETEENQLDPRERIVNRNAAIDVEDSGGIARIHSIRAFERGVGAGRDALNLIIRLADQEEVPLVLDPKRFTSEGLTNQQLKDWYSRNGFVEQKDGSMRREPKQPTEEKPNAVQENLTQAQGEVGLGNAQPNANQNIVPERSQAEQGVNREATPDNVAATQGGISQASDAWLKGIESNDPQAVANAEKELSRTQEGVQELQRLKVLADYDNARLSLRASGDYGTSARQAATQERTRSSQERGRVGQPSGEPTSGEQRGTQETSLTNAEKEYLAKRQKIIDADAAFIKGEISKEEWESKNNTFKKIRRDFLNSLPNETEGQFLERVRLSQEQPTEKTYESVQKQGAREVGVRNAPAVGEGVGEKNSQVPTKEGEAPKEEVELKIIDDEYKKAKESNNLTKAQELFDKIAEKFGFKTIGFHASYTKGFNKFETPKGYQKSTVSGDGFYFGDSPNLRAIKLRGEDGAEIRKFLLKDPEISYVNEEESKENGGGTAYVVRNPKNIKSADLFVYDDSGNLIPLSERFDTNTNDIRGNIKPYEEKLKTESKPVSTVSEGEAGKISKEEIAPKKPANPQEVTLTEEQQAEKVLLDKIDAEAGSPKPIKPKAPEVNPYSEILSRYESGEENAITTPEELVKEVEKLAKRKGNKSLKDAVDNFREVVDSGKADVEPEVEKLLSQVKLVANSYKAPKGEKMPTTKRKTLKDKAQDVLGDAVNGLSYVLENKILDPVTYKKMVKSGIVPEGGGEYDFFYNAKLPKKVRDLIFKRDGSPIDEVAGAMGKTPDELLGEIQEAYIAKEKLDQETKAREKQQDAELKKLEDSQKQIEAAKDNPDKLAAIEAEVLREHFESLRRRSRGEGGFIEFPDFIKDAAIRVGDSVRKGVTSFKDWSSQMISRLGEGVSDFLKDIWAGVRDNWNKDIGGGLDTGGRSLERAAEEAKFAPKPPNEQEAFAKKVADAMLEGKHEPITEVELSNLMAQKFPGITQSEVTAAYDAISGKPKPPTPYAGFASTSGETPEQISIRKKDQADQVRRGILTSEIPAGEGITKEEVIASGKRNLANGADPFDAIEKAKKGDQNALNTARAYADALGKATSEALRKYGPQSKEYKDLAAKNQSYREQLAEAGTYASNLLRSFQGETDLSDAADIAREFTKITGQEPTLSQHEQIRKVADKVNSTIRESDAATEAHSSAMDNGLSEVEVTIPESVEEGRQQIADQSESSGVKDKAEIDRLNAENEQIKKDLKEAKKLKQEAQDADQLKAAYEKKLAELTAELESKPKYGKQVFEQARKIVDKLEKRAEEADKRLKKKLAQLGAFPDVTIVKDVAEIMAAHIARNGLEFAESSALVLEKYGPEVKQYLKDAWAMADKIAKGEGIDKTTSKKARQVKEKPVSKMTPEEKATESLKKRIENTQKKIDDINEGKVSTPKEVQKATNDEISGLEDDLAKKKQELADAKSKITQKIKNPFAGRVTSELNPEQIKTLWESAKKFYLDKGESDFDKMVSDLASDFGLTPEQVRKAFASPKGAKKASDEMYMKQRNRQMALDEANRWLVNQKSSWIGRIFGAAAEKTFKLAVFGHGTAFIGTHAPTVLYTNPKLALKAWFKGFSYSFSGKDGRVRNIVENKDLVNRPNWIAARKGGLENDPREVRREGATPARSDSKLARALDTISGGRGFDALFHLRQDIFDQAWNQLSVTQRTPEMAKMLADRINNATGYTKGGRSSAGILQSPITKVLFFAPKLIASRFKWLIQDPVQMIGTLAKMANPFTKVTEAERMNAIYEAKNKAKFLGVLTGTLLANQALLSLFGSDQKINFTNPKENDWLGYKGFGYKFATVGAMTRIARLVAQEYNAVFGELSHFQRAKGGREAAMRDAVYTYLRSGLSPISRDIIVAATGKDYVGNVAPWSKEQPDRGRRRLTYQEIIQEQFAPIPISEAATQKEIIPAVAKAATAAFTGGRLETPADIEEYQKSNQAKKRTKSNKVKPMAVF